jgi:hypothetical protein
MARDQRRQRKRRAIDIGGGAIYAEDCRAMVKKRIIDEITAAEQAIKDKKTREVAKIMNRWRRLHPTIRNYGKKYTKRANAGLQLLPSMSKYPLSINNPRLVRSLQAASAAMVKPIAARRWREVDLDCCQAAQVCLTARLVVDPYTKMVTEKQYLASQNSNPSNNYDDFEPIRVENSQEYDLDSLDSVLGDGDDEGSEA